MEYHILNLGCGVQSTTLKLLFERGDLLEKIDFCVFADTQEEPQDPGENVLDHLAWMEFEGSIPILTGTAEGMCGS